MPPRRARRPATGNGPGAAPRRICIGCRASRRQHDLVRITSPGDGLVAVGRTLPGRGAWLCRLPDGESCFNQARRRRAFDRSLRTSVTDDAIDDLQRELLGAPGVPPVGGPTNSMATPP